MIAIKGNLPLCGVSKKLTHRRKVDFPDPLGPMITTTSPFLTSKSIPLRT